MNSNKVLFVLLAAAICLPALGQMQLPARPGEGEGSSQQGPAGIPVGPMSAYPGIDFAIGHNDNLLLQPTNPLSSSVAILSPYIKLEGQTGAQKFDFQYHGDFGRFQSSSQDNYDDQKLEANGRFVFSERSDLKLRATQLYWHDPRGTTDRPQTSEPDRYHELTLYGLYGYGAKGAQGRIELDAAATDRTYVNNREFTASADYNTTDTGATFFWRVAPRTRLLFQTRYRNINYKQATNQLDSTEKRYYVGAQWDATAKTSGFFKIGEMSKDFSSPLRTDASAVSWDAGVRWSPLTYSVVDLTASKQFTESTGVGDAVQRNIYKVAWTHAWNNRLTHTLSYAGMKDNFLDATRQDDTSLYGLNVSYQARRWLKFGAEYTYTDRGSNESVNDYKRNLLMFTAGVTL